MRSEMRIASTPKALEYKRMATKHDTETLLERQALKPPPMYQVALLNDDYTPMEFVVAIIQEYFNKDRETATQIMLSVHRYGKGVCGVFSKDIACTKVEFVLTHARKAGHPLQCVMEEV
jgi:ATP-dependent Clp protease adaptor protein ClpS